MDSNGSQDTPSQPEKERHMHLPLCIPPRALCQAAQQGGLLLGVVGVLFSLLLFQKPCMSMGGFW